MGGKRRPLEIQQGLLEAVLACTDPCGYSSQDSMHESSGVFSLASFFIWFPCNPPPPLEASNDRPPLWSRQSGKSLCFTAKRLPDKRHEAHEAKQKPVIVPT